jgi:hypothetical protein
MANMETQHGSHPSDRWVARFYRKGDDEGILDLLVATFAGWPRQEITVPPLQHLRWKLLERDDVRPWQIIVEDAGRVIGLSAIFRQLLKLQGSPRYCDPRAGRWTVHTAEENERLLGYISYRVSKGVGFVGGLLALPDRLDVAEGLLQEAMGSLHRQNVATIQCWCPPRHPYQAVLRRLGIDKRRRTKHLVINAAREEFTFLDDPAASVYFVAGDTDLV